MSDFVEIEARFINLDKDKIEKKLNEIGAKKKADSFFREWIFGYKEWIPSNRRIRVRDNGQTVWLTYKANATWEVDSTEEVEVIVSSADSMVKLLQKSDIPLQRYQEKKRTSYTLDDVIFEMDFWPKIPMVLEIEGPSKEKVMKGATLLGLSWDNAIFVDQKELHRLYYQIDLDKVREYKFGF